MEIHDYITSGGKNLIREYISTRPIEERRELYKIRTRNSPPQGKRSRPKNIREVKNMPFIKVNPIAEAAELQEMFKDEPETKELFHQYELAHRDNEALKQKEQELRNRLVAFRKSQNITQRELETRTGLTQQAISRFETGIGGNIKTILKYADGIGCNLIPQSKASV